MPHRTFEISEVAQYLNLGADEVERLVKDQDIPFERHGNRLLFRKVEIDTWASPRVLGLEGRRLFDYHEKGAPAGVAQEPLLPELVKAGHVTPALPAKTKASVIREMAKLATGTGLLWDEPGLVTQLAEREETCSTGLPGGFAMLHPRQPDSWLFESPFVVLGRTVQRIPFGAPDGKPTDLFFLVACPDSRLHLHTLARICLMAHKTELLGRLREAETAGQILDVLLASETELLSLSR